MAGGPASSLFRALSSKDNVSRIRSLLLSRHFSSFAQYHLLQGHQLGPSFNVQNGYFTKSLMKFVQTSLLGRNPSLRMFVANKRAFSSSVGGGKDVDGAHLVLSKLFDQVSDHGLERVEFDKCLGGSATVEGTDNWKEDIECSSEDYVHPGALDGSHVCDTERSKLDHDGGRVGSSEGVPHRHVGLCDPVELYKELRNSEKSGKHLSRATRETLQEIFRCFARSGWASNQALAIYIGLSFFPTATHKFRDFFLEKCSADVATFLVSLGPSHSAVRFLFPIFVDFCLEEFQDEMKRFRCIMESADMTKPHSWFPFARAMKRKIIYHCGPTNSGKTYNALQRFMEAKSGVYCSPLRLLAMEVFDKVNASGVYCSLLTGQEKKRVPFSNHIACTVEMVSTDVLYDVAVIDEIQMMADPYRGYAWTRALLGLKADEIHLCGDPSVLNFVRKLCSETGDELHECHYERFKPLVVEAKTLLGDLRNVRSGDCVVAFSRREIFEVKMAIEKHTKHRCCVIYGALPPETRRQQANLFNDQDSEYDVLVASDAVGMGLNLNIRRVVFYSLSKYNGDKNVPVPASQVKQIAGRAGRRGSRYPDGLTTALHLEDLEYLIECLKQPFDEVKQVGLFPFFEQVELFAGQLPNVTFSQLLEKFGENCRLDSSYFLCRHDHIKKVANMLEKVQGLSLEDRYNFCFAPVNFRDPKAMHHLLRFASYYSQNLPVNIAMGMPKGSARNDTELLDLETKHQVLSIYLWLSQHFKEETFPYVKKAQDMAASIAELLGQSLQKANWEPKSRGAQKQKPEEKPKQEEGNYERPHSLIKLFDKRRQKKYPVVQQAYEVAA